MIEEVEAWCQQHLGARPWGTPLFTESNTSEVIGLRLDDGRAVVVKVRPYRQRLHACAEVQRRLAAAGYPCPQLLAGPAPLPDRKHLAVTAEAYVPGGYVLPSVGNEPIVRLAERYASALADLVRLAPRPTEIGTLAPPPAWAWWDCPRTWPPVGPDLHVDLNTHTIPQWLTELALRARARLHWDHSPARVGHCDFMPWNLRWHPDGRLKVVHDWDSLAVRSEAVIVGVTAAVFASTPRNLASTPEQAIAFINAYEAASGVPMDAATRPAAFAALLWERAFAAARAHATAPDDADTVARVDRLQRESEIWLELAGA